MFDTLNTSNSLRTFALRNFWQINLHRAAMKISLVENGYMERYRYPDGQDHTKYCQADIKQNLDELDASTDQFQEIVSNLDEKLRDQVYKRINVIPRYSEQEPIALSIDGIIEEMISSALSIVSKSTISANDPDLLFIIDNSLNDLQIRNEDIILVLFNHIKSINDLDIAISLAIIGVYCGLCVAIVLLSSCEERKFVSEKSKFFNSLLRVNEKDCKLYANNVLSFYRTFFENKSKALTKLKTDTQRKENAKRIYKVGNFTRLYSSSYWRVFVTFLILLIAIIVALSSTLRLANIIAILSI